jgi:hypothetical protein
MDEIRGQFSRDERMHCYLQQDNATFHASWSALAYLQACSSEDVMNNGPWPARSPDLYSCNFHCYGTPKPNIYYERLNTRAELDANINAYLQSFKGRN